MKILIGIFFVLILAIVTSTVKINIKYLSKEKKSLKIDFKVNIGFYLFGLIKIFGITFKNDGIHFLFFQMPYINIKINRSKIKNIPFFSILKKLKIKFEKIYLDVAIGTEDAMANAILVGVLSSIISSISGMKKKKINYKKYYYKIVPIYHSQEFNFDSAFKISLKFSQLLKVFFILGKS